jgi:uncharacterized iron-regulated membrane protein
MNKAAWVGLVVGLLVISGLVLYLRYNQQHAEPSTTQEQSEVSTPMEPEAGPDTAQSRYPVDARSGDQPMPALDHSDAELQGKLQEVIGETALARFLIPKKIVQSLVVTINSLDRDPVPLRLRAIRATEGRPMVDGDGETLTLSAGNAARYQPMITALQAVDAAAIAELYLHYYPLFQQAYRAMGYPDAHFNDRLVGIIDHLLATPRPQEPLRLVQEKGLYQFADPDIEDLSSGQKAMIRLGTAHAAVVKEKLRQIRAAVVNAAGSD